MDLGKKTEKEGKWRKNSEDSKGQKKKEKKEGEFVLLGFDFDGVFDNAAGFEKS